MQGPVPGTIPEERFRTLIRATQDAIVQADASGRVVDWNPAAEEMFGYGREEILGEPLTVLMPERFRESHEAGIRRYLETGDAKVLGETVELHGLRADGTEFPIELTIDTWSADDERFFSGIIRDITERKRTEKRLQQSIETWEAFGYGISHDLKEPLRTIKGHLELVDGRLEDADEEIRESLTYAIDGTARMSKLIDGLLAYARVETRGEPPEPTSLEDIVQAACDDLQHLLEESDATVEIEEDLPEVAVDEAQVRQVLQTLIENSVKYSGKEPPSITVQAERIRSNGWVKVRVEDEGIGIEPEKTDEVFRMFHQLDPAVTGSGIGLALSRRIVLRHGGEISAEGEPGEGTTIQMTLPAP